MTEVKMSANHLVSALRRHYIAETTQPGVTDGGVFAHEVGVNGVWGAAGNRRVDALYAGFTSTSGRILVGHEIKTSRADWRNELDQLHKADAWADACHAWYVVAPSTNIVPVDELPHGWGLMTPPKTSRGRRMTIVRAARVREDHEPPWWAVRSLMARLDTLAHQKVQEDVNRRVKARVDQVERSWQERVKSMNERGASLTGDQEDQLHTVRRLERTLGMTLTSFSSSLEKRTISTEALKQAVEIAAGMDAADVRTWHLERSAAQLEGAAAALRSAMGEVEKWQAPE